MSDLVERYIKFFRGRGDVYGGWDGYQVKEPLTIDVFRKHLTTGPHIGVYPSVTDMCSWGCIDIDGKDFQIYQMQPCHNCEETDEHTCHLDGEEYGPYVTPFHDWDTMFVLARNLQTILHTASVSAHIERTRNGFHIWVFPQDPLVKAATMRRALMAACVALDYDPNEVNPKQELVGKGSHVKYGNYVRLSFPGGINGKRQGYLQAATATPPAPSGLQQELVASEHGVAGGTAGGGRKLPSATPQRPHAEVRYSPANDGLRRGLSSQGSGWCGRCGDVWGPPEALPRQELEGHLLLARSVTTGSGGTGGSPAAVDGGATQGSDSSWPQRVFCGIDADGAYPLCVTCWLDEAEGTQATLENLEALAALYTPPVHEPILDLGAGLDVQPLIKRLGGLSYTIWHDGPLQGADRSQTLARLAHKVRDDGFQPAETLAVLRSANLRWGKWLVDGGISDHGELQLERLVQNAF